MAKKVSVKQTAKALAAGVVVGGVFSFFEPELNDLAHTKFDESYIPLRTVLGQEMDNAAAGKGFNMGTFKTHADTYKSAAEARKSMNWDVALFAGGERLTAAESCSLLAANELPIPAAALKEWKTAEAAEEAKEAANNAKASVMFEHVGNLCLDSYPGFSGPKV